MMPVESCHLRLPATSANLGAAFDTAAIALDFALEVEARAAGEFSMQATGRNVAECSRLDGNMILETYQALLLREGRSVVPLAVRMQNGIPLGMGCGSSAAGRLAAICLAAHFGQLGWSGERILAEAVALEGHPDNAAASWMGGLVVAATPLAATGSQAACRLPSASIAPPRNWSAIVAMPSRPLATSQARAVLPETYSRADVVANLQAAALLAPAFAAASAELLAAATRDRLHQPFRRAICPLLEPLLPLVGHAGILSVTLSGAGPSVLLIRESGSAQAMAAVQTALAHAGWQPQEDFELLEAEFASVGAGQHWELRYQANADRGNAGDGRTGLVTD